MQKRREKGFLKPETMKDFKEMVFSRYNRKDVHVNSGIVTACTKVTQAQTRKIPAWRRGCGHKVPPPPKVAV